jgi:ribonuclease J
VSATVRIVFLGGLGEIGRNCFCLEIDGRIVVVDCGLMFPGAEMPGIDLVLPDFTYLRANAERVDGIVLTHGHEDHVGALPYLLADVAAPIYGSALSLGFARKRIEEAGVLGQTELIPVRDGEVRTIGALEAEFVPVTHSVPHAFAVAYRTPVGTILHTGDFKLDLTPVDGRTTDLPRLGQIGSEGVRLLMSDSTNAERPGFTESEATVGPVLRDLLRDHPNRRVAPPPGAAGGTRSRRCLPSRGVPRAFDGAQHRAGARDGPLRRARRHGHRHRGRTALRAGRAVRDLHGLPG